MAVFKDKNKFIVLIVALTMVFACLVTYGAYSNSARTTIPIIGVFEYWQDPTTKKWLYDDPVKNKRLQIKSLSNFRATYSVEMYVPEGYKLVDIKQYDPDQSYDNLKKESLYVREDDIRKHSVENMKFSNKDKLINKTGKVTLEFTLTLNHNRSKSKPKNGRPYHFLYLPFAFICEEVQDQGQQQGKLIVHERHFLMDNEELAGDLIPFKVKEVEKNSIYKSKHIDKNTNLTVEDSEIRQYIKDRLKPNGFIVKQSSANENKFNLNSKELQQANGTIQEVAVGMDKNKLDDLGQKSNLSKFCLAPPSGSSGDCHLLLCYVYRLDNSETTEPYITMTSSVDPNPVTLKGGSGDTTLTVSSQVHNLGTAKITYWEIHYKKTSESTFKTLRIDSTNTSISREIPVNVTKDEVFDIKVVAHTDSSSNSKVIEFQKTY